MIGPYRSFHSRPGFDSGYNFYDSVLWQGSQSFISILFYVFLILLFGMHYVFLLFICFSSFPFALSSTIDIIPL